jgi:hypothetical protein
LLQDNFSGQIVPDDLTNIQVENFEPNLTAHVQPNDQGIICCFKAHYRSSFIQHAIDCYDDGVTPADIYEINQLQAMRLAATAWYQVDTTTIRNCWHKSGILPEFSLTPIQPPAVPISALIHNASLPEDSIKHAENNVQDALDKLITRGALQVKNQIDIESLLNPRIEVQTTEEVSDEEIYQAVIDAKKAQENMEINGRDDIGTDAHVEPHPTLHEVLQAASVLGRYIEESNDPNACKLESILLIPPPVAGFSIQKHGTNDNSQLFLLSIAYISLGLLRIPQYIEI